MSRHNRGRSLTDRVRMSRFLDRHFQNMGKTGVHRIQYRKWELYQLIELTREALAQQQTLLEITPPVNIVGDIHGQFSDLIRMITTVGTPPEARYLFLGDYVDRGRQSVECTVLLFAYKVRFPQHVFLLRGNHECERINEVYGFLDECRRRFKSKGIWKKFQTVFDQLPICALVGEKVLCMHGGLSPNLTSLDQLKAIKKPLTDPLDETGIINDLLWADPEVGLKGWDKSPRQTSYIFGADVVKQYCEKLGIDLIARAHQVCEDGFRFFANQHLVTIFSAPNYCGEGHNNAAIVEIGADLSCKFKLFQPK